MPTSRERFTASLVFSKLYYWRRYNNFPKLQTTVLVRIMLMVFLVCARTCNRLKHWWLGMRLKWKCHTTYGDILSCIWTNQIRGIVVWRVTMARWMPTQVENVRWERWIASATTKTWLRCSLYRYNYLFVLCVPLCIESINDGMVYLFFEMVHLSVWFICVIVSEPAPPINRW